jgi:hypothetical protein
MHIVRLLVRHPAGDVDLTMRLGIGIFVSSVCEASTSLHFLGLCPYLER